jgi:hypothetical protein
VHFFEQHTQLQLGQPSVVEQQIAALARATVEGWYDERSQRAIAMAVRAPQHTIAIQLPTVDYYADSVGRQVTERRTAEGELARLRGLKVGDRPVFLVTETIGAIARGRDDQGVVLATLKIHPELAARYLGGEG